MVLLRVEVLREELSEGLTRGLVVRLSDVLEPWQCGLCLCRRVAIQECDLGNDRGSHAGVERGANEHDVFRALPQVEVDQLRLALHYEGEYERRGRVGRIEQQLAAGCSLGQNQVHRHRAADEALACDRDVLHTPLDPVFGRGQQPQDGRGEALSRIVVELSPGSHRS
jgi:hypothetical protein